MANLLDEKGRKVRPRHKVGVAALVLLAFFLSGCKPPTPPPVSIGPGSNVNGTQEMAALLKAVAQSTDPRDIPFFLNEKRARLLYEEMEKTPDPGRKGEIWLQCAIEILNSGQTDTALEALGALEQFVRRSAPHLWPDFKNEVLTWRAIAFMRKGEQENCCAANTPDTCLLPIRGAGVHRLQSGSTEAIRVLAEVLQEKPDDLRARWLINIATMTIGKYPNGLPVELRIPESAFKAEYPLKRFRNVAPHAGLDLLCRSGGLVADDLDDDGFLDIMVSALGFDDPLRFFHNNGDGTFSERTKQAGLTGETGGLNMISADYDNDGHTDIFLLRGGWMTKAGRFPSSLIRNNGNGTFVDVTKRAGLLRAGPTQAATWLDYDGDGQLDLFVGYESGPWGSHPCALYHNNGNGTFTDVARRAGVDVVAMVKAAISADYDNDGRPDLFLTRLEQGGARNILYHNNGNGTFTDVAEKAGIEGPRYSFPAFFFDYDNDGWQDLFVSGFNVRGVADIAADYLGLPTQGERACLYHNNRDGTFTDVSKAARLDKVVLGMGINYGDLDNDGYLDFYVGTGNPNLDVLVPNRMFRNAGGRLFQEVTSSGGFGHLQKGHAIAFADFNNDGNQDVFEQMGGANYGDVAYSTLFANPGHDNRWITLKLEGSRTNRSAIGARIKVTVSTPAGPRDVYKTVRTGGSFGAGPLRQEIGLGRAQAIQKIEIYWPVTGKTQILKGLQVDRAYAIREDRDVAIPVKLPKFAWQGTAASTRSAAVLGAAR
jgi:hypothetical protein